MSKLSGQEAGWIGAIGSIMLIILFMGMISMTTQGQKPKTAPISNPVDALKDSSTQPVYKGHKLLPSEGTTCEGMKEISGHATFSLGAHEVRLIPNPYGVAIVLPGYSVGVTPWDEGRASRIALYTDQSQDVLSIGRCNGKYYYGLTKEQEFPETPTQCPFELRISRGGQAVVITGTQTVTFTNAEFALGPYKTRWDDFWADLIDDDSLEVKQLKYFWRVEFDTVFDEEVTQAIHQVEKDFGFANLFVFSTAIIETYLPDTFEPRCPPFWWSVSRP